jgi:hypothetical protein
LPHRAKKKKKKKEIMNATSGETGPGLEPRKNERYLGRNRTGVGTKKEEPFLG